MDPALNFLQLIETKFFQLRINKSGYWEFRHIGNDSNSEYSKYKRWKLVHRVVAELKTGPIPRGYQVHHVDHDKTNNHPSNLQVLTIGEHRAIHRRRKQFKRLTKKLHRKTSKPKLNKKKIEKAFKEVSLLVPYNYAMTRLFNAFAKSIETNTLRRLSGELWRRQRISYNSMNQYYLPTRGGTCYRCGGTGHLPQYWYYAGGVCFSCGGNGRR